MKSYFGENFALYHNIDDAATENIEQRELHIEWFPNIILYAYYLSLFFRRLPLFFVRNPDLPTNTINLMTRIGQINGPQLVSP